MILSKKIFSPIRNFNVIIVLTISLLTLTYGLIHFPVNSGEDATSESPVKGFRIQEIQERGKLIAITEYSSTDYFIYRGEPMGFHYEKLKTFADYLGVELEVRVARSTDEAFRELEMGDVDLVAMGLTVTGEKPAALEYTEPILQTRQMLVQRKPANWRKMRTWDDMEEYLIRNTLDLGGKTVYVQEGSVYAARMENLSEEIGSFIDVRTDSNRDLDQLVEAVATGAIDYTICGEHMANFFESMYPDIDIKTPVSFPQYIAWGVREDSDSLMSVINSWLRDFNQTATARHIQDKYYNSPRTAYMAKSEHVSFNGGKISRYDEMMRELSLKYDFDWRLLAALVYQESQFHPDVKSWAGAFGLMQLMPSTAKLFGVDSTSSEFEQLEAGIRYLKVLDQELKDDVEDEDERIKFILAAYNVGIAHVFDARRLAEKNGKDPNIWKNNVDYYILNKSNPDYYNDSVVRFGYARGEETYNFVLEVLDRFEHYKNVIED